jgi:oligosaccharide repeat unit polymerase
VYDFRNDAAENLPSVFSYLSPLIGKVVLPIAFVLSLLYRKYVTAALLLGFAALIFGLTSHKSVLFSPFLILFVYLVSRGKNLIVKFNAGLLLILLTGVVGFWLSQEFARENASETFEWIGSLTMRRTFFLPTQLNFMYYDFFSKNDLVLFSNSKLTFGLIDYKYPLPVTHLIGQEYFGNEEMGANTGWFGGGYMQAGFYGLLLYAAAIGVMFRYIDACARNSGERALITAAVVVPVLGMLTSSDLPVAFFTHGLYLNLLLIACFKRRESSYAHSASE